MKSGIYTIINQVNGKFYIGSACNIKRRWAEHKRRLNRGVHKNKHLRNAWNKYGEENFKFKVLEPVENKEDLLDREQWWMDLLKPEYNISLTAGSQLGFKHSEESKQKMSGENNPMFGRTGEKHPMYGQTGEKCPKYKHAKCWEYNGKIQPMSDWAKEFGIDQTTLNWRVTNLSWSLEQALLTPVATNRKGENNPMYKHAKRYDYDGKSQPLSDWAKEYGINRNTLETRLRRGWSLERALLTPTRPKIRPRPKKT